MKKTKTDLTDFLKTIDPTDPADIDKVIAFINENGLQATLLGASLLGVDWAVPGTDVIGFAFQPEDPSTVPNGSDFHDKPEADRLRDFFKGVPKGFDGSGWQGDLPPINPNLMGQDRGVPKSASYTPEFDKLRRDIDDQVFLCEDRIIISVRIDITTFRTVLRELHLLPSKPGAVYSSCMGRYFKYKNIVIYSGHGRPEPSGKIVEFDTVRREEEVTWRDI